MSTPCVFISYRHDDSAGWAGRLGDDLADRIGADRVFRDVKIPAGVDYEQHIERMLDGCDVVLAVIGPQWATAADATGQLRLHLPGDLLRKEIERALQRPDVEVIPVLVQRARMPDPSALPEGLRALTRRQAVELSDTRWTRDVDELVAQVFEELDHDAPRPRPQLGGGVGASAMVAAGVAGIVLARLFTGPLAHHRAAHAPEARRFVYYAAERGLIWALVGACVLAAASVVLRDDRAGAFGWAIVGAGYGAVGGALGGTLFMLLKDVALKDFDSVAVITHGSSTALTGVVLGAAVATVVSGERATLRLAGLVGGLLGTILAVTFGATPASGRPEGVGFLIIEAIVMIGALGAVAAALTASRAAPAEAAGRIAARARRPANT
jgi:hypothetical protein